MAFPVPKVQTVANQGREGMQRPERGHQETTVQLWGRVLVPPQGIQITISLSSSTELTPAPQQMQEDVNESSLFWKEDPQTTEHQL